MNKDIKEDLIKDVGGENPSIMVCGVCDVPMAPMKSTFSYLKREFRHTVLRCPVCGQIYISEDLAKGKMREVETILEEK
jgi:RNase P subunit RPR2